MCQVLFRVPEGILGGYDTDLDLEELLILLGKKTYSH